MIDQFNENDQDMQKLKAMFGVVCENMPLEKPYFAKKVIRHLGEDSPKQGGLLRFQNASGVITFMLFVALLFFPAFTQAVPTIAIVF